ncbi:MAG: FKBP-type peptidyl-prolyl cis-trans isomerase [Lentisphaeraceae bacterium]|nr:FKBP-type peptidyl-prolyl cis-trans isomerase [Lentisphaeraceae bacterium]
METNQQKVSYLIGRQVAENLAQQGIEIDNKNLFLGIEAAAKGEESPISQEDAQALFQELESGVKERLQVQQAEVATKNSDEGAAFLADNASKDGVNVTSSGLQYKVIKEGDGSIPTGADTVETHYEGSLISGEIFDSSIKRGQPVSFPVSGVIQGWQEALKLMPVGSVWEVYIPGQLAYGEAGSPPNIGPNSTLVFTVELIKIH